MTGKGHRLTGIGAAFFGATIAHACSLPEIITAAVAAASCTLPDWAEIPFFRNGMRTGSLIAHRTLTHWPLLWLGLFAWGLHEHGLIGAALVGLAVGCLTHILCDAPNPMGIPWLVPHQRLRIGRKGLWRSGEHEFLIAVTWGGLGYGVWRLCGGGAPF